MVKKLLTIQDILSQVSPSEEVYSSDTAKRKRRSKRGIYARSQSVFDFLKIVTCWSEIVGELLASNTIPLKTKNGTLFILSKHSVFSQQLEFMSLEIIRKIEKHLPQYEGSLKKVKFYNGNFSSDEFMNLKKSKTPHSPIGNKKEFHRFDPQYRAKKVKFEEMYKDIDDLEMKELLISISLNI